MAFRCGFKDSVCFGKDFLCSAIGLTGADEVALVPTAPDIPKFSFLCGEGDLDRSDDLVPSHDGRFNFREKLLATEFRGLRVAGVDTPLTFSF
jgi:hypothetical protein